jgi:hypothetical protein
MDYNVIIQLEMLVLNFINWKFCLFSVAETINILLRLLNLDTLPFGFVAVCNDYKHFVLSEFDIFINNDLFVISLTVLRLALKELYGNDDTVLNELKGLFIELGVLECKVIDCEVLIMERLYSDTPPVPGNGVVGLSSNAGVNHEYNSEYSIETITAQLINI